MVKNYRRNPSNRNAVLRRGLRGNSHIFYPLQGTLGQDDSGDDGGGSDIADLYSSGPGSGSTGYYTPGNTSTPITLAQIQASTTQGDCLYGTNASGGCLSPVTAGQLATAGFPLSTTVATSPSPTTGYNSPSPTSLATAIAQDISQIAAPIVKAATQQSPYYITNPATGQSVLYNPNTGTTSLGTSSISSGLASLSPTTILIGIVLIGALALGGKH